MKAMRNILEEFLQNSTPEQLRAELAKGNRPFFQTLEDSVMVCANQSAMPVSVQANVSFFEGIFAEVETNDEPWNRAQAVCGSNELALAA